MDVDELDAWLGTGDDASGTTDGEGRTRPPWGEAPPRRDDLGADRDDRRRRWVPIVGGALLLWVLVMAVAFGRGAGPTDDASGDEPSVMDLAMAGGAPSDGGTPVQGTVTAAAPTGAPAPAGPEATTVVDATTSPGDTSVVDTAVPSSGERDFGAIVALRAALGESADGTDRYLEWAVPVDRVALHDEVELVVLDAVWLSGRDGTYDRAEGGRWAVPVGADGAALTAPWALGPSTAAEPPDPVDPPVLRQRVAEVEDALATGGWSDVVVHASDAHPELTGVWVVVVDGVDPAGIRRVGALAWLHDDGVLRVLGGDR